MVTEGYCPDCAYRGFVAGPNAGLNWNIECGNLDGRHRFNVTWYAGRVQIGERLEKRSEGGTEWLSEPKKRH